MKYTSHFAHCGIFLCGLTLTGANFGTSARADEPEQTAARFALGTGNLLFLAAGVALPILEDGKDGKEHALRTVDSLLTSTLITATLKRVVRDRRPDDDARTAFPSGHATAAFAAATMQSHYHPRQAPLWYGGATLIALSRVELRRHDYDDVLAGAAVGYFTSRFELKRPRGLILAPFIPDRRDRKDGGFGLQVTRQF